MGRLARPFARSLAPEPAGNRRKPLTVVISAQSNRGRRGYVSEIKLVGAMERWQAPAGMKSLLTRLMLIAIVMAGVLRAFVFNPCSLHGDRLHEVALRVHKIHTD